MRAYFSSKRDVNDRCIGLMKKLFFWLLISISLLAHPHTFINVSVDIIGDKEIEKLDIKWVFDEMTSQSLLADFDANNNGLFEKNELEDFKKSVFDDLKQFSYFTNLKIAGKKIKITPTDLHLSKENNNFVAQFTLNLKPFAHQKKSIGFWDESYLCALSLEKEHIHSSFKYGLKEVDNAYYYGYLLELP